MTEYEYKMLPAIPGIDKELFWPEKDVGTFGYYKNQIENSGPIGDWYASHKDHIEYIKENSQGKTVIQAGGAMGLYPLFLANYFQSVHTFEPSDINYYFLSRNVAGVDNIKINKAALGSEVRYDVKMQVTHDWNLGMNKIESFDGDIPMTTIDTYVASNDIDHVDFIWLDLEGFEDQAIQGAVQTITKFRPVIALENAKQDTVNFFGSLNYKRALASKMDTFIYPF